MCSKHIWITDAVHYLPYIHIHVPYAHIHIIHTWYLYKCIFIHRYVAKTYGCIALSAEYTYMCAIRAYICHAYVTFIHVCVYTSICRKYMDELHYLPYTHIHVPYVHIHIIHTWYLYMCIFIHEYVANTNGLWMHCTICRMYIYMCHMYIYISYIHNICTYIYLNIKM